MKKSFVTGFICGGIIFAAITGVAVEYAVTTNPYPIKVDGVEKNIEGYNINDSTYFKLRDVADAVGGFNVGFEDDTILISKEGYVYDSFSQSGEYTDSLGNQFFYQYNLPAFNFDTDDAAMLNKKIEEDFSSLIERELKIMQENCSVTTTKVGYKQYGFGDVATVLVEANDVNDIMHYGAYSINKTDGSEVSNSELIAMTGTSEEDFIKWIKNLAGACYTDKFAVHASVDNELYKDRYDFTISDEACNIDLPMYFDENGQLVVLAKIGSMAGASWYYSTIETGLMAE